MVEHRERLRKAIDNMEETSTCLDIYDRGVAARLAALEQAGDVLDAALERFEPQIGRAYNTDSVKSARAAWRAARGR